MSKAVISLWEADFDATDLGSWSVPKDGKRFVALTPEGLEDTNADQEVVRMAPDGSLYAVGPGFRAVNYSFFGKDYSGHVVSVGVTGLRLQLDRNDRVVTVGDEFRLSVRPVGVGSLVPLIDEFGDGDPDKGLGVYALTLESPRDVWGAVSVSSEHQRVELVAGDLGGFSLRAVSSGADELVVRCGSVTASIRVDIVHK